MIQIWLLSSQAFPLTVLNMFESPLTDNTVCILVIKISTSSEPQLTYNIQRSLNWNASVYYITNEVLVVFFRADSIIHYDV